MEKYGIKASLYDFFGYFIPGIIFYFLLNINYYNTSLLNYILSLSNIEQFIRNYALFSNPTCIAAMIIIIVVLIYITGLIISFFSALFFGKLIKVNVLKNVLTNSMYLLFTKLFKKTYSYDFSDNDFRLCITEVECFAPASYNTALTFLSLYGLHRSLSLTFLIFAFNQLLITIFSFNAINLLLFFFLSALAISFFFGYKKFYCYYFSEIASAFIMLKVSDQRTKA